MSHSFFARIAGVIALLLIAGSCTATETVTINDSIRVTNTRATVEPEPTAVPRTDEGATAAIDDTEQADPATESDDGADPATNATDLTGTGCAYLGVDDFGDMQIELQFTSPLTEQSDATVFYTVNQGASVLVDATRYLEDLLPGEAVRISTDTVTDPPANDSGITCQVNDVKSNDFDDSPFRASASDTCRFVETDFADDIQIALTVVNPFDETIDLAIDYVLRGPGGVRFQDGVHYIDAAVPGTSIEQPEDTLTEFPAWVNEDTFSCEIVAIQGL